MKGNQARLLHFLIRPPQAMRHLWPQSISYAPLANTGNYFLTKQQMHCCLTRSSRVSHTKTEGNYALYRKGEATASNTQCRKTSAKSRESERISATMPRLLTFLDNHFHCTNRAWAHRRGEKAGDKSPHIMKVHSTYLVLLTFAQGSYKQYHLYFMAM